MELELINPYKWPKIHGLNWCFFTPTRGVTPPKINIQPENDALVRMIFLFQGFILIFHLGGGFKYLLFSALPGEMNQFDKYFSNGLVQPPTCLLPGVYNPTYNWFSGAHRTFLRYENWRLMP